MKKEVLSVLTVILCLCLAQYDIYRSIGYGRLRQCMATDNKPINTPRLLYNRSTINQDGFLYIYFESDVSYFANYTTITVENTTRESCSYPLSPIWTVEEMAGLPCDKYLYTYRLPMYSNVLANDNELTDCAPWYTQSARYKQFVIGFTFRGEARDNDGRIRQTITQSYRYIVQSQRHVRIDRGTIFHIVSHISLDAQIMSMKVVTPDNMNSDQLKKFPIGYGAITMKTTLQYPFLLKSKSASSTAPTVGVVNTINSTECDGSKRDTCQQIWDIKLFPRLPIVYSDEENSFSCILNTVLTSYLTIICDSSVGKNCPLNALTEPPLCAVTFDVSSNNVCPTVHNTSIADMTIGTYLDIDRSEVCSKYYYSQPIYITVEAFTEARENIRSNTLTDVQLLVSHFDNNTSTIQQQTVVLIQDGEKISSEQIDVSYQDYIQGRNRESWVTLLVTDPNLTFTNGTQSINQTEVVIMVTQAIHFKHTPSIMLSGSTRFYLSSRSPFISNTGIGDPTESSATMQSLEMLFWMFLMTLCVLTTPLQSL